MSEFLKPEYERKLQKLDSVEDYNTRIRPAKWSELEKYLYLYSISNVFDWAPLPHRDRDHDRPVTIPKLFVLIISGRWTLVRLRSRSRSQ